jgi:hypothetical protein
MLYIYRGPYPPSINHSHTGNHHLTKETADWYAMMPAFMNGADRGAYDLFKLVPWTFTLWLNLPRAEGDISNRCKIMEDAMAKYLGLNDRDDHEIHIKRTTVAPDRTPLPEGQCVALVLITGLGEPKKKARVTPEKLL